VTAARACFTRCTHFTQARAAPPKVRVRAPAKGREVREREIREVREPPDLIYGASPMWLTILAVAAVVLIPIGWSAGRGHQRHVDAWARDRAHRRATAGIRRAAWRASGDAFGIVLRALAVLGFGLFLLLTKGH
jgi:hypothetical protein